MKRVTTTLYHELQNHHKNYSKLICTLKAQERFKRKSLFIEPKVWKLIKKLNIVASLLDKVICFMNRWVNSATKEFSNMFKTT